MRYSDKEALQGSWFFTDHELQLFYKWSEREILKRKESNYHGPSSQAEAHELAAKVLQAIHIRKKSNLSHNS